MSIKKNPYTPAQSRELDSLCRRYVDGEFGSDELLKNLRGITSELT